MINKETTGKVISALIKSMGRDVAHIADELGITKQRLGQYKNGQRLPRTDFFQLWKDKFGHDIIELCKSESSKSPFSGEVIPVDTHRLLVTDIKQAYERSLSEVKTSMRETIDILQDERKEMKKTISELLKRIPTSQ